MNASSRNSVMPEARPTLPKQQMLIGFVQNAASMLPIHHEIARAAMTKANKYMPTDGQDQAFTSFSIYFSKRSECVGI
jgi:hypothetical protein